MVHLLKVRKTQTRKLYFVALSFYPAFPYMSVYRLYFTVFLIFRKGIVFSPFNGVKLIPNRHNIENHQSPDDERNNCNLIQKFSYDQNDDIDSDDDYYDCDCMAENEVENGRVNQHLRF